MAKSARHRSRILVMQSIYALEFHGKDAEIFEYVLNEFGDDVQDETFAKETFEGVLKNKKKLDKIIEKAAPEWPLKKIALLDLSVLRIGVYEIMLNDDIPNLVAINEAIEISKEFGGYNNAKFINGVLSNVMNNKEKYAKL